MIKTSVADDVVTNPTTSDGNCETILTLNTVILCRYNIFIVYDHRTRACVCVSTKRSIIGIEEIKKNIYNILFDRYANYRKKNKIHR